MFVRVILGGMRARAHEAVAPNCWLYTVAIATGSCCCCMRAAQCERRALDIEWEGKRPNNKNQAMGSSPTQKLDARVL
jgi:hypothetical protein